MTSDSWHADENSALRGGPYPMVNIGSVMHEVSESVDAKDFTPLSVGNNGVTAQLEGVAKSATTAGRKLLRKGQLAINSRSDRRGAAGVSDYTGSVSVVNTVIDFDNVKLNSKYLHYLIRSRAFQEEYYRFGTGIVDDLWSTRFSRMAQIRIPLPPLETQCRIADYLDRETGQIDETITRIDKLVELLEERHQAFIDSSVQGSGKYAPLSLVIKQSQTGPFGTQLSADEYVSGGIPLINPTHIQGGELIPEEGVSVSLATFERLERFALAEGDLVLGRKGDVRKSALITEHNLPALCGSDSLFLRPHLDYVNPYFLRWWFKSSEAFNHLSANSVGSTLSGLNQEIIQLTRVPIPPLDEQTEIVYRIEAEAKSHELMKVKAQTMRSHLQERRSALITAAVTGKIDV